MVKEEQPENIRLIYVTPEVSRCSRPSMCLSDSKPANQSAVLVGWKFLNEAVKITLSVVAPIYCHVRELLLHS